MEKEKFRELSLEVLPMISGMMDVLKNKGEGKAAILYMNASDGHFNMDIRETGWEFSKYSNSEKPLIRYQYKEEIELPDRLQGRAAYNHATENVIEITQVFACASKDRPELNEIESDEWKQKFVEWANEYEYGWEDDGRDYIEDITKFAAEKINEFYEEVKGK